MIISFEEIGVEVGRVPKTTKGGDSWVVNISLDGTRFLLQVAVWW